MQLDAQGQRMKVADATLERLSAKASLLDLYAKPIINAAIAADRATVAGEVFSQIRLDATGSPSGSDIALSATARQFDLAARGRLVPDEPRRFDLATFTARRDRRQISLARPTSILFANGGVALRQFEISLDGGTISLDGSAGSTLGVNSAEVGNGPSARAASGAAAVASASNTALTPAAENMRRV